MKFICMGFISESNQQSLSEEDGQRMMEECFAYDDELRRGGHFLGGEALQSARNAVTLRMKNGSVDVTDGPYAETKEMLGGILLLDARDLNHAISLMSNHPGVKMGPFEIRPAHEEVNQLIAARGLKIAQETAEEQRLESPTEQHSKAESRDAKTIFVNLPVADLKASVAFYEALGFKNNPQFSDDTAACMVWSETIHAMLLTHEKWRTFTTKPIPAADSSEVMLALSCDSQEDVDKLNDAAAKHGGTSDINPKQDLGFMYSRSSADLDGHIWEMFWMDASQAQQS